MKRTTLNKALITGGAGFIGSHLTQKIVEAGCEAVVVDNLATGNLSNLKQVRDRITFIEGDIQDSGLLRRVSQNCDVIFHQAAVVSVPTTIEQPIDSAMVNEIGTLNVLEAARQNETSRVVLASSCAVYGDDPEVPKQENMIPKPLSPYAVQKLTGEHYAGLYNQLYDVETVCLRYFNVFGPRQDPSSPYSGVISIFAKKSAEEVIPIIYGTGEQYRDFVYVEDVVEANLLAANIPQAAGNIFNIGTGKFVTINTLWDMVSELNNCKVKPQYESARLGDIQESAANIDLARKILGFEPKHTFQEGLKETIEWYNDNLSRG